MPDLFISCARGDSPSDAPEERGDRPKRPDVCGDPASLVKLAKTRVTRELTDTERATYLSGD